MSFNMMMPQQYAIKHFQPRQPSPNNKQQNKVLKVIGKYAYDQNDKIGSGFSSNVFKGTNEQSGQIVAIKVIDLHKITTPISKTLLNNEIEVLRKIDSHNLIKVFDIYQTKNNTYIVTEYCKSGDLADLIHQNGPMPEERVIEILKQILNGMMDLKAKCIIHRDIKPANILIDDGQFKIADFGFALTSNTLLEDQILKNFNVGTPLYMSPETIIYNQYSEKSDIWALGIVLYEMLHGYPPYKASSDSQLLNLYLTNPLTFSTKMAISRKMKSLIQYMLMLETNQRFGLDDVINYIQGAQQTLKRAATVKPTNHHLKEIRRHNNNQNHAPNQMNKRLATIIEQVSRAPTPPKQLILNRQHTHTNTINHTQQIHSQHNLPPIAPLQNIIDNKNRSRTPQHQNNFDHNNRSRTPQLNNNDHNSRSRTPQLKYNDYNRSKTPQMNNIEYHRSKTPQNRQLIKVQDSSKPSIPFLAKSQKPAGVPLIKTTTIDQSFDSNLIQSGRIATTTATPNKRSVTPQKSPTNAAQKELIIKYTTRNTECQIIIEQPTPKSFVIPSPKSLAVPSPKSLVLPSPIEPQFCSTPKNDVKVTKKQTSDTKKNEIVTVMSNNSPKVEDDDAYSKLLKSIKQQIQSLKNPSGALTPNISILNTTQSQQFIDDDDKMSEKIVKKQTGGSDINENEDVHDTIYKQIELIDKLFNIKHESNKHFEDLPPQQLQYSTHDSNIHFDELPIQQRQYSTQGSPLSIQEDEGNSPISQDNNTSTVYFFCRFVTIVIKQLNEYIQQDYFVPKLLESKCLFLLQKCAAIKSKQLLNISEYSEFTQKTVDSFTQTFKELKNSSQLPYMIKGDRRFEVLFDDLLEEDCSGFYAIMNFYLKEMIKQLYKILESIQSVNPEILLRTVLLDYLTSMHLISQEHIKCFHKMNEFSNNCKNVLEEIVISQTRNLSLEDVKLVLQRAKNIL